VQKYSGEKASVCVMFLQTHLIYQNTLNTLNYSACACERTAEWTWTT
jgi:hypothetical protein